jgi:hypothetical protein
VTSRTLTSPAETTAIPMTHSPKMMTACVAVAGAPALIVTVTAEFTFPNESWR